MIGENQHVRLGSGRVIEAANGEAAQEFFAETAVAERKQAGQRDAFVAFG